MKVTRLLFAVAALFGSAIGDAHCESDLVSLAPWIHGQGIQLGMSRSDFVEKRPNARNVYFGDSPADPIKPFNGQYVEGNPHDKEEPVFIFIFQDDHLVRVHWGVQPTDIDQEVRRIRNILHEKYGEPIVDALPRLNFDGYVERLSTETYRSNGLSIMIAAGTPGGIEASIYKINDDGSSDFDSLFEKLRKSGKTLHSGTPTIDDVLARIRKKQ